MYIRYGRGLEKRRDREYERKLKIQRYKYYIKDILWY
jgi:hypothetical protein